MDQLYAGTTQLFYQISNAFFWPVAIALLTLLAVSLADLGALFVQTSRRARSQRTDLAGVARYFAAGLASRNGAGEMIVGVSLSAPIARFWAHLECRLREVGSSETRENLDLWLEETLQREEIEVMARLDRSRALVRLGPMLGLAGTIIPLGPALQSLLGGDMAGMVNHLVVGFGAVVCGLVMSGLAYVITLIRERWARLDLKEMENLCELLLRALNKSERREAHLEQEAGLESFPTT